MRQWIILKWYAIGWDRGEGQQKTIKALRPLVVKNRRSLGRRQSFAPSPQSVYIISLAASVRKQWEGSFDSRNHLLSSCAIIRMMLTG